MASDAETLERRLLAGWEKCEATPRGSERERLEEFWITLLRQYEAIVEPMAWPDGSVRPLTQVDRSSLIATGSVQYSYDGG
jgi:hypothetical protein